MPAQLAQGPVKEEFEKKLGSSKSGSAAFGAQVNIQKNGWPLSGRGWGFLTRSSNFFSRWLFCSVNSGSLASMEVGLKALGQETFRLFSLLLFHVGLEISYIQFSAMACRSPTPTVRTPRPTLDDPFLFSASSLFCFSASCMLIFLDFFFSASKKGRKSKARCFWGPRGEVGGVEGALGSLGVEEKKRDFGMDHIMGIKPAGSHQPGFRPKEQCALRGGKEEVQKGPGTCLWWHLLETWTWSFDLASP